MKRSREAIARADDDGWAYSLDTMPAFLFTDLESSTRLWEEHPEEMGVALARHDAILSQAVSDANGTVVKSTGDGMLAVFDTATDSTSASVAAQLGLSAEEWPIEALRVRIGVHVGQGEARGGDIYGADVNRAARIMAAGHGGQVLLSSTAAEASRLPEGVALRDLGIHRLKDLTLPEHLYQLLHEGLESEFPPPATLDAVVNNLPIQISEFFGREQELAAIGLMLDAAITRLLTLTGPGGAGKTRLSLQIAAERIDSFEGVFFVDLAADTDPQAAYESIVRSLDFTTSSASALQILKTRLRDQRILLILDNLEQVMESATGLVELIQHCPDLKLLVTSREPLRVRAEQVYPVPPLSLPHPQGTVETIVDAASVMLFLERARAVRPDFSITESNAATIAEICLRLDGLPLAIELAAARLSILSPGDLMERLRGRLDVLASSHRDLPDRQRTLWGAIGWSYEMLVPTECRVFEMMSVFSPTGLRPLEEVARSLDLGPILDVLSSLVDKSLIRSEYVGESQQFSMLHTIREYAAERLAESGNEDAVRRAQAAYFSGFASRLQTAEQDRESVLNELAAEIGNLQTAWRYWVDQGDLDRVLDLIEPLWAVHDATGAYSTAIRITDEALDLIGTSDEHASLILTMRMWRARAMMSVRGYSVEVEESYQDVLEALPAVKPGERLRSLRPLASYYINSANLETAGQLGAEMLEPAQQQGDPVLLGDAHYVFGLVTALAGDHETGFSHLDRSLELFDTASPGGALQVGPSRGVQARAASALMKWELGSFAEAAADMDAALDLARELQHPISLAFGLWHHGLFQFYRSRFEQATERALELARVAADNDYPLWKTLSSVLEGVVIGADGDPERGRALTEAGVELYRGLTTPPVFWPLIQGIRGLVFLLADEPAKALALVDDGLQIAGDVPDMGTQLRIQRGDVLRAHRGHGAAQAEEEYRTGLVAAEGFGFRTFQLQALNRLVDLRRADGRTPDGSAELRMLYESFTDGFDEHDMQVAAELLA